MKRHSSLTADVTPGRLLTAFPVLRCAAAFSRAATHACRRKILVGKVAIRDLLLVAALAAIGRSGSYKISM